MWNLLSLTLMNLAFLSSNFLRFNILYLNFREMMVDPLLTRYSVIMLDEVSELTHRGNDPIVSMSVLASFFEVVSMIRFTSDPSSPTSCWG